MQPVTPFTEKRYVEKGPRRDAIVGLQSAAQPAIEESQNATLRGPAAAIVLWQFDAQRLDLPEQRARMDAQSAGCCLAVSTVSSDCLRDVHLFQGPQSEFALAR